MAIWEVIGTLEPRNLVFGSSVVCPSKIYVGIGNGVIASLQYGEAKNKFNVTIVTNTGSPVANTQVYCATNGQYYETNGLGQIPQVIETEPNVRSIEFTWSTTSSTWTTVDGSLQQYITTTNNYSGVATITSGDSFSGNCSTTTQITNIGAEYRINVSATIENFITIGARQYIIAQVDADIVYAVLRYWEGYCQFDSERYHVQYYGSDIAAKCESWYSSAIPEVWKTSADAFSIVYNESVGGQCFIPTYSQANGGWDYFNSDERRKFKQSESSMGSDWWTSTDYDTDTVWFVSPSGKFLNNDPRNPRGFRPALAIKRSLFTS